MNKLQFRQAPDATRSTGPTSSRRYGGPKLNPPLTHVLPSVIVGGHPDFDPYPYDLNKAKQLISQAGGPTGSR